MTRQDLVNKSIDKLNTVKEALELIEISNATRRKSFRI